VLLG
jgi:hypothetical protein